MQRARHSWLTLIQARQQILSADEAIERAKRTEGYRGWDTEWAVHAKATHATDRSTACRIRHMRDPEAVRRLFIRMIALQMLHVLFFLPKQFWLPSLGGLLRPEASL